jgi:hypothetical protein
MWKIVLVLALGAALSACSREQVQNGLGAALRNACAQHDESCTVHCGAGEHADRFGQCNSD